MVDDTTTNDIQLNHRDVQQLADAAQVVNLFARLHYNVDESVVLGHAALGLDNADLRQQILHIRRIGAGPVGGNIVIYLFEVRAPTVALTQTVARRFRDRPEDALLVLTKDYETLDFVLIERELAPKKQPGRGMRQVMRPRTLTVHRRNPDRVAVHVLQRFTCTEGDADFQWEKLRSAFTLAEWSEPYFNNRALFSDYYLTARLTDPQLTPAWAEEVRPIGREVLRHLSQARRTFSGQPKQMIREQLYEPLFQSLGFHAVVNQAGDADLDAADYRLYAPGQPAKPVALAMTTVWNRNLDDADPSRDAQRPEEIPGARVVNVLARAEAPWVIVTNGKLWRLYSTTADNKVSNTYEIDLEEAATASDQETALKYWWLFFRCQAFTGFLDDLVQQSAAYARGLGERLKERTFATIFPRFAAGFIQGKASDFFKKSEVFSGGGQTSEVLETSEVFSGGGQTSQTSEVLETSEVFRATLTFLYRLMFILYAESLNLLPLNEERGYGQLSLARLKQELADTAGKVEDEAPARLEKAYRSDSTALYARVQRLFQAIDAGDAALNLPLYNGGLFSTTTPEGRFLASHAIPDRFLAQGLDRLCRDVDDKTQALAMIDYKSLGVRQLGSIYEGLLEFKLRMAAEKLVVVKEKGREIYLPAREAGSRKPVTTLNPGDVYLENDKRERKATGSYYTPDYIVKYIVEHTVGPVLERKFETLRPRLHEAQKRYRQRKAQAEVKQEDPEKFWNNADMQQLANDCLDVKVLDPAMGSGHFLVEAVDFISDRLIEFLNAWSENPVWALLARTRQDILEDMEQQGVSIDGERLTRVSLLRRSVLKRCVYGVDLNAMAVELAKVSLWLDAFTLGAPLSFLDHHLKHGNSLIGARVQEVRDALAPKAGETFSLLAGNQWAGIMLATDLMRQVSFLSDNTAGQLHASQAAYRDAGDHLAPYKRILDVYTSRWFGNGPSKKGFEPVLEFLRRPEAEAWLKDPARVHFGARDYMNAQAVADTAQRAAAEKRFFHWELEFPEVFFAPSTPGGQDVQLRVDGGFDAVVANPPYVTTSENETDKAWRTSVIQMGNGFIPSLAKPLYSTLHLKWDLYVPFVEQFYNLLRPEGMFGTIIPSAYCIAPYAKLSRNLMATRTSLLHLIHFPDVFLFDNVGVQNVVLVAQNLAATAQHTPQRIVSFDNQMSNLQILPPIRQSEVDSDELFNPIPPAITWENIDHVRLGEICYVNKGETLQAHDIFFRGAFIKDDLISETADDTHPKPYVEGKFIGRGEILKVCYLEYGENTRNPSMVMEARFPEMFENPKLLFGKTSGVYPDVEGVLWCDQSARVAVPFQYLLGCEVASVNRQKSQAIKWGHLYSLGYLYAISASNLIYYYLKHASTDVRDITPDALRGIPVRSINFNMQGHHRAQLATEARAHYEQGLTAGHAALLAFVTEHLALDESDVIHDLLAFLAEQMIELNKRKQAEVRRFLGWLEGRLAIRPKDGAGGIDSLSGKTILQGYLGDYQKGEKATAWADFYHQLHKNRGRFAASLEQVAGEIEDAYAASLAVLLPIKQQLASTDALIDQVVYRLYGLTDDEITIVERPAYEQALDEAKRAVLKQKELADDIELATAAIADHVLPAAQRLQTQVPLTAERARLDANLPGWHLFPDEVVTFLLTGEHSIASLPDFLDFSTSVVSYAKAVETMLYHRLFMRFRAESGVREADCHNAHLQKFVAEGKPLTLGSMGIILASSKEAALRAFIMQVYPRAGQTFDGPAGVVARLQDPAAVLLRNQAAHDTTLTRADARIVREWALGILQYL